MAFGEHLFATMEGAPLVQFWTGQRYPPEPKNANGISRNNAAIKSWGGGSGSEDR